MHSVILVLKKKKKKNKTKKQVNSIIDDKQVYHTSRHYAGVYRSQVLSKTFLKEVLLSQELAS